MNINLDCCSPRRPLFKKYQSMPLFKGDEKKQLKQEKKAEKNRIKSQPLADELIINGKKYVRTENCKCKPCDCD